MTNPLAEVAYRVGPADELTWVGGGWDDFARGNAAPELAGGRVLGRRWWEFVSDPPTRALYRAVLARARGGVPVEFPLRCDSPDRRRRLTARVAPAPGGAVEFRVRTVAEETRPVVALLDPGVARAGGAVRVCAWCSRIAVGRNWVEAEEAVARLGLFERPAVPGVTHGICPDCAARMTALVGPA